MSEKASSDWLRSRTRPLKVTTAYTINSATRTIRTIKAMDMSYLSLGVGEGYRS
jgi:hypothetical protein